jgi:F0F1-type ATP synthase alpha subunit
MRELSGKLRLEYAQLQELEVFTRFGTMLDERSRVALEHGRRIRAILQQQQYRPLSLAHQVGLLLAVDRRRLDEYPLPVVERFRRELGDYLVANCPHLVARIHASGRCEDEDRQQLLESIDALLQVTSGSEPAAS